jgi:hypothetical protein
MKGERDKERMRKMEGGREWWRKGEMKREQGWNRWRDSGMK